MKKFLSIILAALGCFSALAQVQLQNGTVRNAQLGITLPPAACVPSYANTGGTGNRTSFITVTVAGISIAGSQANPENWVNGLFDSGTFFGNGLNVAGATIQQDFGVGHSAKITEFKWYQDTTDTHGTWQVEGSFDGSTWTAIGATFTLGGVNGAQVIAPSGLSANTTFYRFYHFIGISGTSSSGPFIQEIENKICYQ